MDLIRSWSANIFNIRFELLAIILVWIIFGGSFISGTLFHEMHFPTSVIMLIAVSIAMVKNERKGIRLIFKTIGVLMFLIVLAGIFTEWRSRMRLISLIIPLAFLVLVSVEVFKQMVLEKTIARNIIVAAFDCYLLLGILGAILFTIIIHFDPTAYSNVEANALVFDKMLYFSFITLTSIGYGDITPVSSISEKLTSFYGLIGHFYSVVIVGIIVGKYVSKTETLIISD